MRLLSMALFVVVLFFPGSPAAILWRIRSVVVDAIKGQTGRTRPHVGNEVAEAMVPPLTHSDSAPAVILPCMMPRIEATILSGVPYQVFRGVCFAVLVVVMFLAESGPFSAVIASSYVAAPQFGTLYFVLFATFATANPVWDVSVFPPILSSTQHGEFIEHLAGKVDLLPHARILALEGA